MSPPTWDPTFYDAEHSFVWELAEEILGWLDAEPGERIIDLGCGTGHLTARLAAAGVSVTGLDISEEMIAAARARYPEVEFLIADARTFVVDEPVDAVFSNATLHWIPEADQVAARVFAALRPGGRLVAEFGGSGNVARIGEAVGQVLGPLGAVSWPDQYYPSPQAYTEVLSRAGFAVRRIELVERPTLLPAGLRGWLQMFRGETLRAIPSDRLEPILGRIIEAARPHLYRAGRWFADYVRLRIEARKP